jgi:hypothetical protein
MMSGTEPKALRLYWRHIDCQRGLTPCRSMRICPAWIVVEHSGRHHGPITKKSRRVADHQASNVSRTFLVKSAKLKGFTIKDTPLSNLPV